MIDLRGVNDGALSALSIAALGFWAWCWWRTRERSLEASFALMFCAVMDNFHAAAGGKPWVPFFADLLAWMALVSGAFVFFAAVRNPRSFTLGPSFCLAAVPAAVGVVALRFAVPAAVAELFLLASVAAGTAAFVSSVRTIGRFKAHASN